MIARLEQVALLGMPHAVIGPGAGVLGIGGERAFVPNLGVVVAAELAARIADQVGDVRVVVVAKRLQRGDTRHVIVLLVDDGMRGLVAVDELLLRLLLLLLGGLLLAGFLGRLVSVGRGLRAGRWRVAVNRARPIGACYGEREGGAGDQGGQTKRGHGVLSRVRGVGGGNAVGSIRRRLQGENN